MDFITVAVAKSVYFSLLKKKCGITAAGLWPILTAFPFIPQGDLYYIKCNIVDSGNLSILF
jgi:hypothetical protein